MEAIECIEKRRSIRSFTDEKISHEVLNKIVKAASFAPSWKNTQVTRYTIIENKEIISKIASDCVLNFQFNTNTINGCAALVVVSVVHGRSGFERDGSFSTSKEDRWETFDAGIATQTFCLAAHEMGVGSVIMGIFDEKKVADCIDLPEGQIVTALVAIGYPKDEPVAPKRKAVEDLVRYL